MTSADRKALVRLVGGAKSDGVTTDDLQGLLLQVVFALLIWWIPMVLPENGMLVASVLTVAALTPTAMALSFMCQISGRDPLYGSNILALSTVLCCVTVPVMTTILTAVLNVIY